MNHQEKKPEYFEWLNRETKIDLVRAVAGKTDLGQSDRVKLVKLFTTLGANEADRTVLDLCLPLFPAQSITTEIREGLEMATTLLQGYYPHAAEADKKPILAALNAYIAIQCAACMKFFRWPASHNGPEIACPHCNDPVIRVSLGSFGWIDKHKALNANKQLPRLTPRED